MRELEKVGAHVVFGVTGLKTHSKAALVVRQEEHGIRCYAHIATGNYHSRTARLYEDFGLLTADQTVGEDITDLFNHLTGYSRPSDYRRLLVAPEGISSGLVEKINIEAEKARARRLIRGGLPSHMAPPSGCVFNTRCPLASQECREIIPPLEEKRTGHFAACIKV